jgi:hypothetical protein
VLGPVSLRLVGCVAPLASLELESPQASTETMVSGTRRDGNTTDEVYRTSDFRIVVQLRDASAMSTPSLLRSMSLAVLLTFSLAACDGKAMAVQAPIDKVAAMPMEKSTKIANFGSWTNTKTKGGALRTITVKAGPWAGEQLQMDFEYDSGGGATTFASTCAYDASGQNVGFTKFGENGAFACTITPAGGEAWELYLLRSGKGRQALLTGKVQGAGQELDISMTRTYADGSSPLAPVGYHFALGGTPVAAVQITNPPQVWMAEDLDPALRDVVAAGVGALVLSYPAVQQTMTSL